jgi:HEAT repeat protein
MSDFEDGTINNYLHQLDDEDQEIRIHAINQLGETGDILILKELRERLKWMTREHQALIIAVAKLKRDLGIK